MVAVLPWHLGFAALAGLATLAAVQVFVQSASLGLLLLATGAVGIGLKHLLLFYPDRVQAVGNQRGPQGLEPVGQAPGPGVQGRLIRPSLNRCVGEFQRVVRGGEALHPLHGDEGHHVRWGSVSRTALPTTPSLRRS